MWPKICISLLSSNLLICIIKFRTAMIAWRNFELVVQCFCQAIVFWPALISITGYSLLVGSRKNKKLFRKELNKLEKKFAGGQKKLNSLENKMQSHVRNQSRKSGFWIKSSYEDNKIRSQKSEIDQPENCTRKIYEECLQLYCLVKKATEKLDN